MEARGCGTAREVMRRFIRTSPEVMENGKIRYRGRKYDCYRSRPDGEGWEYHCGWSNFSGGRYIDSGPVVGSSAEGGRLQRSLNCGPYSGSYSAFAEFETTRFAISAARARTAAVPRLMRELLTRCGSSATKAVLRGKRWFCQREALPG